MATRFEFVLHGGNPVALRAAGEEAIAEVVRLEGELSLYRPSSQIANVNARAALEPVRVSPEVFALLQRACALSLETGGAFDITIAPLVRCWGFMHGHGAMPDPRAVAEARAKTGLRWVELDARNFTVRFARDGVMLDLGAIGKGYAIDCASDILREAGVASALIHGGTSTVSAIGHPPDADAWNVAVEDPAARSGPVSSHAPPPAPLAVFSLKDESLSVSSGSEKSFQTDGKAYGHVLDPRTGQPTDPALLAAVALPSATESDALSTALLVLGHSGRESIERLRPGMRTLIHPAT